MLIEIKRYIYLDCKCGKALEHRVKDDFSDADTVIIEPCSCGVESHLIEKYGLKTADEIYALGVNDGHIAAEAEARRGKK